MTTTPRERLHPVVGALLAAGASLVGIVIILGLLEFAAGFVLPRVAATHGRDGEIAGDTISKTMANLDLNPAPLVSDADLLWTNAPGVRKVVDVNPRPYGTEARWNIATDADGHRITGTSGETGGAATGDVLRILCVGDSITFGFNVDQPGAWPSRLLDDLRERYAGRRFEVINAGVPGWTWIQGLKYLETRGLALHPDVVVMSHGTNDQFFEARITDEERFRMLGGPLRRSVRRLLLALSQTNLFHVLRSFAPTAPDEFSPGCRVQVAGTGSCRRVDVEQIKSAVGEAARLVRGAGAALLVLNNDFLGTAAGPAARIGAEAAGVGFVDAVDALARLEAEHDAGRARQLGLAAPAPTDEALAAAPRHLVLRATVPDPSLHYRVEGSGFLRDDVRFAAPLHDDGEGGDERAGDGVLSAAIDLPPNVPRISYLLLAGDAAEFLPLPPLESTRGGRLLRVGASGFAPVEEFGRSWFMAEQVHPNDRGQRAIAALVADRLAGLPSFQRHVGSPSSPPAHSSDGEPK